MERMERMEGYGKSVSFGNILVHFIVSVREEKPRQSS